ncbi:MAG: MFS transporter [Chloroflexi bacterium]|nr:MFS transporter [Chloroflexota bacterium]
MVMSLYTGGVVYFGFTAIFEPIVNEFGWSYAQVSFVASLRGLEIGLLSPVVGLFIDRWGPRRLMFGGAILTGIGLVLTSQVNSLGMLYAAYVLVAIGTSTCSATVLMTVVVFWFRKKLSLATGIVAAGFALGGLLVPLINQLIVLMGWRGTMTVLGIGMWVVGLPLSLVVRHRPEQYGYLPDGEETSAGVVDRKLELAKRTGMGGMAKYVLTSRVFWHVAISMAYQSMAVNTLITHVMPYLSSIGVPRSTAGLIASAVPMASAVGRLGYGWLGDRFEARMLTSVSYVLMGLGLLLFGFASAGGMGVLIPFSLLFGIGWGGNVVMRATLLSGHFDSSLFGTAIGFVVGVMMFGNVSGPPLAGWVFDNWGNYQIVWFSFAALAVGAAVLSGTTPRPRETLVTSRAAE